MKARTLNSLLGIALLGVIGLAFWLPRGAKPPTDGPNDQAPETMLAASSESIKDSTSADGMEMPAIATPAFREWIASDPLTAAERLVQPDQRTPEWQEKLATLMSVWAEKDPASAANWIDTLTETNLQQNLFRVLITEWSEGDPMAAAALAASLPGALGIEMSSAVASAWGRQDIQAATGWAQNLPDTNGREAALFSLGADWAEVNPRQAAECALTFVNADRQNEMLYAVGSQWGKSDSSSALAWAGQLSPGSGKEWFLSGIGVALGESSPATAANVVASMMTGTPQTEAALAVVLDWAESSPATAAEWVSAFPEGTLRDEAWRNLVSAWTTKDSAQASDWLASLPASTERDTLLRTCLDTILDTEPALGVRVAASIGDASARQEQTERVVQHWLAKDPDAAGQWLSQWPLVFPPVTTDSATY